MKRSLERGQSLVFFTLVFIFLIVPFTALALDLPSLWTARRDRQKLVDEACLAGAIAAKQGNDIYTGVIQSLDDNGVDPSLYTPNEGSGVNLGKGIEIGSSLRVALWGPTLAWWSQLIPGVDGWQIGARAHCMKGIGAFLPLALKEFEGPGTRILETADANDEWSGICPDQDQLGIWPPSNRNPPNCWVWGDLQILAGDGHRVNEGDTSMNGLIAPDVRCVDAPPGPANKCDAKYYTNAVPDGAAANTLKSYTKQYIQLGGYNGPLPVPGCYGEDTGSRACNDMYSALIAQQEGVSNNFLAQEVAANYNLHDLLVVFVYRDGELYDGNRNFDYVEVIGYVVVSIEYIDANTIGVKPVDPASGRVATVCDSLSSDNTAQDFDACISDFTNGLLYPNPDVITDAGYIIRPILLPWN
jgi:hypothetical protein